MVPMLDAECLKLIQQTAVAAARVDVSKSVAVIADPDQRKAILIDKDGNHEIVEKSEPTRRHRLLSVASVVDYAKEFLADKPVVWISQKGVVVTHDGERILGHRADYAFETTEEFDIVTRLGGEPIGQREFLKLLRVTFARSFSNEDRRLDLIQSVRSLRAQQDSRIGSGSGSFETGLISTAGASLVWPESFVLEVRVFSDPSIEVVSNIECVLDVD